MKKENNTDNIQIYSKQTPASKEISNKGTHITDTAAPNKHSEQELRKLINSPSTDECDDLKHEERKEENTTTTQSLEIQKMEHEKTIPKIVGEIKKTKDLLDKVELIEGNIDNNTGIDDDNVRSKDLLDNIEMVIKEENIRDLENTKIVKENNSAQMEEENIDKNAADNIEIIEESLNTKDQVDKDNKSIEENEKPIIPKNENDDDQNQNINKVNEIISNEDVKNDIDNVSQIRDTKDLLDNAEMVEGTKDHANRLSKEDENNIKDLIISIDAVLDGKDTKDKLDNVQIVEENQLAKDHPNNVEMVEEIVGTKIHDSNESLEENITDLLETIETVLQPKEVQESLHEIELVETKEMKCEQENIEKRDESKDTVDNVENEMQCEKFKNMLGNTNEEDANITNKDLGHDEDDKIIINDSDCEEKSNNSSVSEENQSNKHRLASLDDTGGNWRDKLVETLQNKIDPSDIKSGPSSPDISFQNSDLLKTEETDDCESASKQQDEELSQTECLEKKESDSSTTVTGPDESDDQFPPVVLRTNQNPAARIPSHRFSVDQLGESHVSEIKGAEGDHFNYIGEHYIREHGPVRGISLDDPDQPSRQDKS